MTGKNASILIFFFSGNEWEEFLKLITEKYEDSDLKKELEETFIVSKLFCFKQNSSRQLSGEQIYSFTNGLLSLW